MKKIAVIGASYLQLPLVLKILELGYEAICFSWEKDAVAKEVCSKFYPISIVEKEEILKICKKESIDGILTIASDVAMPTVAYVANQMELISNSILSVKKSTNKYLMRKVFEENNLNIPRFYNVKDINLVNDDELNFPVIVKPTDSSGSKGISLASSKEELIGKITQAINCSFANEAIVEEYIEGKEISVEIISYKEHHTVLALTEKRTSGQPNFVELEQHQPFFAGSLEMQIKELAVRAVKSLGIQYGASHVELMITPTNEIYVIEVGARMGGDFIGSHLVELSTGYDFLKAVVDISLGTYTEPILNRNKKYSGVYFLSSKTKWVNKLIEKHKKKSILYNIDLEKNTLTNSGDRYGYFIYQFEDLDERNELISNVS